MIRFANTEPVCVISFALLFVRSCLADGVVLWSRRNLYNEWIVCTKKAEEAGENAKTCHAKRHNALAICPDEWVSVSLVSVRGTTHHE